MRKTSKPNKLSTNRKPIYGGQRVCEENKLEELEKENKILLKYFAVKGLTLKGCRRTVTIRIDPNFVTRILHNIKVLVT